MVSISAISAALVADCLPKLPKGIIAKRFYGLADSISITKLPIEKITGFFKLDTTHERQTSHSTISLNRRIRSPYCDTLASVMVSS